jgi:hypothetical protein
MRAETAHSYEVVSQSIAVSGAKIANVNYPLDGFDCHVHVMWIEGSVLPLGRKLSNFTMGAVEAAEIIAT